MEKQYFFLENAHLAYQYINNHKQHTVLFIHGAGSNLRQFEKQVTYFSKKHNVLNVTLHGHDSACAESPLKKEDFRLEKLAKDVFELCASLEIQEVIIVGNSAGGLVGLELLKQGDLTVKTLVTFGTSPRLVMPKFMVSLVSKIDARMIKKRPRKYLSFAVKACTKHPHVIKAMTAIMMESKHAAAYIRSQIGRYDYLEVLEETSVPCYLLHGPMDKSINKSLKKIKKRLKAIDTLQWIYIDDSGHFMNLDQPEIFNSTIDKIIENNIEQ